MTNKESKKIRQYISGALIAGLVALWISIPLLTNAASGGGGWTAMLMSSPTPTGSPGATPTGSPNATPTGTPFGNNFFANLTGPPINGVTPTGFGEFETHSSRIELEVRVDNVNLGNGTALQVDVDGALAGTMVLDDGEARLRLRSDEGDTVPNVHAGSTAVVRTGATVRLTGTFAGVTGTPGPTATPTGTPGGTPNASPTATPNASPTATPNASPTATPNASPTATPNASPTATPNPTRTPTPTPPATPNASPTPPATPPASPNPSPTATPFGTPTASPSPTGSPVLIRRFALLRAPNGGANPHGDAEWDLEGNRRELEIRIEGLNFAPGTVLSAFVDGNHVGTLIVDSNQRAELRLRTQDGQNVPFVNDGSTIHVLQGNTVVVQGVFGNVSGTPTPTGTPFGTPTPGPTGTPFGTPTPGPTATPAGSPNPSPTGTATPNPSPTGTATPNPTPSPTGTPGNNGDLFASLTGPVLNGVVPLGFAEFEIHSSRTELEVRVRQVNLAIGSPLSVIVDGSVVGSMTVRSGGEAELRLRSDNGQNVPPVVVGSTISVSYNGTAILSGIFGGNGPIPSPSPIGTPNGTPNPSPTHTPFGRRFEAHLNGSRVIPPVNTTANGEIKVTLNANGTQATVFGEFHGLSSDQTGARVETTVGTITTVFDLGVVG